MNRICHIDIDESGLARPTPEIEQERKVAIFDLLEDNSFGLPARDGREKFRPAPIGWAWPSARGAWSFPSPARPKARLESFICPWGRSAKW